MYTWVFLCKYTVGIRVIGAFVLNGALKVISQEMYLFMLPWHAIVIKRVVHAGCMKYVIDKS